VNAPRTGNRKASRIKKPVASRMPVFRGTEKCVFPVTNRSIRKRKPMTA